MLGSNLAKYQLAAWADNAGSLKLRLSNKSGREKQTKTTWEWSETHNKNDMKCGKRK